ncbi:MAG: COX15/CtaA family protein [Acidobacteriaceae bacterium]|nr:COX15/CtaA family protein [Acidobacteriaceae bacterium]
MGRSQFARFAWGLLAYNIPVILWGAYVRASYSGDGCGANWPFCNGIVLPQHMAAPMAIEFTHRATTSLDVIATVAMCVWAFVIYPRRHAVRRYAVLSLVFLLIEAALGAGLVLLRYVAKDQSAGRAWYLSAHLTNTMLLLAALTATAWFANRIVEQVEFQRMQKTVAGSLGTALIVSITGALAALGDTLFPAVSLARGVAQDFSRASSGLLRLRLLHPAVAVIGSAYIIWAASCIVRESNSREERDGARLVVVLALLQIGVGALNIGLLAPIWLQLAHLFVADVLWISLVVLGLQSASLLYGRPANELRREEATADRR